MTGVSVRFTACAAVLSLCLSFANGQSPPPKPEESISIDYREAMVPMRDGVKLQAVILTPKGITEPLPILYERGPYGVPPKAAFDKPVPASSASGRKYIRVVQNIRGRFKSEGAFVMQRPPHDSTDPKGVDETTDAWDTVAWLVKEVPGHNGKVGIRGQSYNGWTAVMAALDPHPAVKAILEEASPADMFLGDDFHHNGAFRLTYGFEYAALLESAKEANTHWTFDKYDTYEWYLDLGPLSNANAKYFHGRIPTWNDFVAHPSYD